MTTAAAKPKAQLTELAVSYSYDIKANIGNYESAGVHITRSEKWNVTGLTQAAANKLYKERYAALKAEVDPLVEEEYANLSIFAAGPGDDK